MLHEAYLQHLQSYFLSSCDDRQFWRTLQTCATEFMILTHFNLDPAREVLESLYSPVKRSPPRACSGPFSS
jgi:hypothetical protein